MTTTTTSREVIFDTQVAGVTAESEPPHPAASITPAISSKKEWSGQFQSHANTLAPSPLQTGGDFVVTLI